MEEALAYFERKFAELEANVRILEQRVKSKADAASISKAAQKLSADLAEPGAVGNIQELRDRACPAGLPHTGDNPEEDHGHTDCFFLNKAADEIERLQAEIASMVASAQQLTQLVNEWVDVQPGRTKADMDRRISIAYDLRKAVGR
jgi:HAMP domain-containing protein